MTKKHYVVAGVGEDSHLATTKGGAEFAADGTTVLRIVLSDGDEHLINFGDHQGAKQLHDGVLHVSTKLNGPWLRSYRDWSYYEDVPYAQPARSQGRVLT